MLADEIQKITAYIAVAVPATVAIANIGKIVIEWLNQKHTIRTAQVEQTHQITTHYLDRALDPQVPLAIRHQLLRFLATPDKAGSRLSDWASSELTRVGSVVEEANRAVTNAEQELHTAKTAAQIAAAERKLAEASNRQKSLLEPPIKPRLTAAALRAGLIEDKELDGLVMTDKNLIGMHLTRRKLRGADFSGSDLLRAYLTGSDLRAASFSKANLTRTHFMESDLRSADLRGATLVGTDFQKARLEGADLRDTTLEGCDMRATYDAATQWPTGVDPEQLGAVLISAAVESPDTQASSVKAGDEPGQ